MLDYIIVGAGLSGITIAEELLSLGKSVRVFENNSQSSSTVAGGIYNPVILKRFTLAWEADKQLNIAIPFYRRLEEKLNVKLIYELPVYRKFHSVEEQNNWFSAMDKPSVAPFLDSSLVNFLNPCIPAPHALGRVKGTGKIDTALLLQEYREYLRRKDLFTSEEFQYEKLEICEDRLSYKGLEFNRIIFCEGFGLKKNPFFNFLPLQGNKGEYLIVKAKDLRLEVGVKSSVFILPLGDDLYKVGATYDHRDKSPFPTVEAREKLQEQLTKMITCDFEIVDQVAGIRPATKDRKPLAGQHPEISRLYCCNGFGSRGVLIAPTLAKEMVDFMEYGKELSSEVNLNRFDKSV